MAFGFPEKPHRFEHWRTGARRFRSPDRRSAVI